MPDTTADRADDVVAWAPGRVNLMGDHTDQTGGRVLPMAVDLGTTVRGRAGGARIRLRSSWAGAEGVVDLPLRATPPPVAGWGGLVAAVAALVDPHEGFDGTVDTTLPVGAGLSSSAALALAVALALGFDGPPPALAELGRAAEQAATGVPCGVMDQLASAAGVDGHALRIDCHLRRVDPVPLPEELDVVVVHSGQVRTLATTPYARRVAELRAAEAVVGPLRAASLDDLGALRDRLLRRRARHVVTENDRVDRLVAALRQGDRACVGTLLAESHASLRDDLDVSTPALDALVAELDAVPGVLGARLTGAGFGGCVVALAERGTPLPEGRPAWRVRPAAGAGRRSDPPATCA